jgi:catechol 2,3-dioxygenase-like lactoylglutathione lyase family enzyme
MIRLIDVAHVNLNVTDLRRAVKFYTEMLGFRLVFQHAGKLALLNFGQYRDGIEGMEYGFHDLALYTVPTPAPEDFRTRAGMNHVAFRLRTPEEVDQAASELQAKGVKILKGPLTHKEDRDRYLYIEDPDHNVIELVASTVPGWPEEFLMPCR